jgi:hypothetical protein
MNGNCALPEHAELVRFVREVLGCGCPDEVVARTVVDIGEAGEPGLDVGGRLLVRVLLSNDLNELVDVFPQTVERLRAERDGRSFNRLRLVVHSVPEATADVLRKMLPAIAAADDEVYLHHVDGSQLPTGLVPSDHN